MSDWLNKVIYDFSNIEKKWQAKWLNDKTYEPDLDKAKRPFYNLMMFPYPSAEGLHVGNMYAFTGSDIYGRFKRMQGYDVFEPIGLDGFGIHSENYAIRVGKHPSETTKEAEKNFYRQLQEIGNGFAWDEKVETYDPSYYKWTQWIFIEMFKHGLAYRKKQSVNWCLSCKTVLADEQVVGGACERCVSKVEKRELEQWFFKITDYAERLLNDLDPPAGGLDWSEKIKIAQRNWIGKSEGAFIKFPLRGVPGQPDPKHFVDVFTTRPDTIFGATFVAISPELAKQWISIGWQADEKIKKYVEKMLAERVKAKDGADIEKTGVDAGIKAVNPASKEEIPVWVVNYVLGDVGTGAIMAVPAHDERDNEFAKKYNLPIKEVIVPERIDKRNPPVPGKKKVERRNVHVIVRNPKDGKILCLKWNKHPWTTFPMGGVETGEDILDAARREVREETGYKNLINGRALGGQVRAEYFAAHKDENRVSYTTAVCFDLKNEERDEISQEEHAAHEFFWANSKDLTIEFMTHAEMDVWLERLKKEQTYYVGEGMLINSDKFDGVSSDKAKWGITKFVGGEMKVQYHLRDWLISRQRYWGPPIPMIYCESCAGAGKGEKISPPAGGMPGWYAVPEKDLPVELPFVKDFRPKGTGVSPLASVKEFYEVKCPVCGKTARRETDVSDTFLDSSWYYIGYLANRKALSAKRLAQPFSNPLIRKWLPVDMYIGGAEHAVLHLLYFRFIAKALHDFGLLDFSAKGGSASGGDEPAKKFRAHGLLIRNGKKISKSKGNIVNPDEFVKKYGADVLRLHLMFIGPFEEGGDFRDSGILGPVRFLDRVWKLSKEIKGKKVKNENKALENSTHRTIKKVTEDVEALRYNTAVSALMILFNDFDNNKDNIGVYYFETFLKLLAPFAPHITEEIWSELGYKTSIHKEEWPKYDSKKVIKKTFTLVIQVNGRVRDVMESPLEIKEDEARRVALNQKKIREILQGREIKKVIFVPKKLINFVVS